MRRGILDSHIVRNALPTEVFREAASLLGRALVTFSNS